MSELKVKLRRLKYTLKHDYLSVENVVLFLAVGLCLMWTFQSVEAMARNWELTEKLGMARKNLELINVEVEAAELENEYYQSNEYQELMARKLANKQLPGENMVYLPENSEAAKTKYEKAVALVEEQPEYSNFEKWMMYLFPNR